MERRLAAILAADVVGYSKLMGEDEKGTLAALKVHRKELFDPETERHGGRIVKLMGDGVLVEFPSVVDAVECAMAIQKALTENDGPIRLRIGVNLGDVIVDGDDIYGDGVNLAARLETLAEPGGILVSDIVYQSVHKKIDASFADMGEQKVKNISEPQRTYRIDADKPPVTLNSNKGEPSSVQDKPSIAVLAFTNMSGDPEQEYFSDGISEDIITELSRFQELFVIARNSSFSYKGKSTKVQDIGKDLGVTYVVEGSVRKSGKRLRITVQLIEAATGNHIWAERYDRELEDMFELQDEITQTIVRVLPLRLQGALVERARKKPSENLTAYECFLRAQNLYDHTSRHAREALEQLETAIRIDPKFAQAFALTAYVHAYSVFTLSPIGDDPTIVARKNIVRALDLGEGDHYVHAMACEVFMVCGEHDLAEIHSDKALALNPNEIFALLEKGVLLNYSGNSKEAVEHLQMALAHDPLAPDYQYEGLAEANYMLGNYEEAIRIYERWRDPPVHMYSHLAACYAQLGLMEESREAATLFESGRPKNSDFSFYAAAHARLCKRPEDAEHWLEGYRKAGLID
ncbi:MAG: adenylate/guanylate cyclase domain-containing protein [Pseudomonadota bacterium]